jgi:Regulator of chromosome condensation (RCC1) repeat
LAFKHLKPGWSWNTTDGLCLNSVGEVFAWGKGSRGQLGCDRVENDSPSAVPVHKAVFEFDDTTINQRPVYRNIESVSQISAGMIHSAALEKESNDVYIWGKHILPPSLAHTLSVETTSIKTAATKPRYSKATDAIIPVRLRGLPPERQVLQISCGSHHTSMLLDDGSVWAVGLSTDSNQPLFTPVCLIAAGVIEELPVRHFEAHMDRTTVVTGSGQVLQVHLWEDPANQNVAVFTPTWALALLAGDNQQLQIQSVHRSWLHTLIVTKDE